MIIAKKIAFSFSGLAVVKPKVYYWVKLLYLTDWISKLLLIPWIKHLKVAKITIWIRRFSFSLVFSMLQYVKFCDMTDTGWLSCHFKHLFCHASHRENVIILYYIFRTTIHRISTYGTDFIVVPQLIEILQSCSRNKSPISPHKYRTSEKRVLKS